MSSPYYINAFLGDKDISRGGMSWVVWPETQEQYEMQASSLQNILWGCGFSSSLKSGILSLASDSGSTWEQTDYRVPIPVVSGRGKKSASAPETLAKTSLYRKDSGGSCIVSELRFSYFKQPSLKLSQMLIYWPLTQRNIRGAGTSPEIILWILLKTCM